MKIKKITALVMAFTVTCGVTQAVNNYSPVSFTASAEEAAEKAAKRGGFEKKILLVEVKED